LEISKYDIFAKRLFRAAESFYNAEGAITPGSSVTLRSRRMTLSHYGIITHDTQIYTQNTQTHRQATRTHISSCALVGDLHTTR
jgi:hypothetical protein